MSLPKIIFSDDKESLAQLGDTIKAYFITNKINSISNQNNAVLTPDLVTLFTKENLEILLQNQLVSLTENKYKWNFLPVINNNLLLFCDFPTYERYPLYVWLSTNFSGGSWNFAQSLPIRKSTRVLDLGTGTGLLALMARLKGGTSVGIDINPRAIQLAKFNRDLNGLDLVEFRETNWKLMDGMQFDLIVSQPPFGFSSEEFSLGSAFDGGTITGLQATKEIVQQFCPQENQTLMLYVHVLENNSHTRFRCLLKEWTGDESISISLKPQSTYPIKLWWESQIRKHLVETNPAFPSEFQTYHEVVAYFAYLTKN